METTVVDDNGEELKEKQKPTVREGRLRRAELPFKELPKKTGAERTDKVRLLLSLKALQVKPKKAKGSVVAVQQVSKKKARKLLRNANREQRQKERQANAMQES